MLSVEINYLAVLAAGVASMILGAIWYSPKVFGTLWMRLSGLTTEQLNAAKQKGMAKSYAIAFIGSLVMAYVLAHFADYAQATTFSGALQLGFWTWLGFMATKSLGSVLWENRPVKLYVLNNAYDLVNLVVMAVILVLWV